MFGLLYGMRCRLTPLLALILFGCATTYDRDGGSDLEYGCNDLVVIGRIVTSSISKLPSTDPNDPLPGWLGEFGLQVHIKRVIQGSEHRAIVPATLIAHGQIRGDRDFLIVLRPVQGNGYTLRAAALKSNRPKLSEPCLQD